MTDGIRRRLLGIGAVIGAAAVGLTSFAIGERAREHAELARLVDSLRQARELEEEFESRLQEAKQTARLIERFYPDSRRGAQ